MRLTIKICFSITIVVFGVNAYLFGKNKGFLEGYDLGVEQGYIEGVRSINESTLEILKSLPDDVRQHGISIYKEFWGLE